MFCLHKDEVVKFKRALKDRTLDPERLVEMSSDERRQAFADVIGKGNAQAVNSVFESKMLLKNVQQGMITWAKQVAGIKPQVRRDIVSRIERMDEKLLNPDEQEKFLKDLAAQKLGVEVSYDEVKAIHKLAQKVETLEKDKGSPDKEKRLEYGRAVVDLTDYVNDRKKHGFKWSEIYHADTDVVHKVGMGTRKVLTGIASNSKAIQASLDNSAVFRQGWKALWTHPGIWARNARQTINSFAKMYKPVATQHNEIMRELNADIVSRPTYDLMRTAKLDVAGITEEAYPTNLPEHIPLLGRVYKATENAYTAMVQRTRADVFDKMVSIAQAQGVELTDKELQAIGKMVNSLTGRGNIGKLENLGGTINNVFFSIKLLKSHLDVLTQPFTGATPRGEKGSKFVRRQATMNLLKMAGGLAVVLAIAKFFDDDSVENDPRSADFGKIKIGDTRFEVAGGMSSLLTLLARLVTQQTKDSKGKIRSLTDPEYGKDNLLDVIENFFENKVSPAGNFVKNFLKGETFEGKKPTLAGQTIELFTPLPLKTLQDLMRNPKARETPGFIAFAEVMDMLGFGTSTRNVRPKGKDRPPDFEFWKSLEVLSTFATTGNYPIDRKPPMEAYLESPEFKKASTDDLVAILQIETDMPAKDKELLIQSTLIKAGNAAKAKKLTEAEIQQLQTVIPDFTVEKALEAAGKESSKKKADNQAEKLAASSFSPTVKEVFDALDIPMPGFGDELGGKKLTPEQKAKYEADTIERIEAKVNSLRTEKRYKDAPDHVQKKMIEGIIRKQRREEQAETKKEMGVKFVSGLRKIITDEPLADVPTTYGKKMMSGRQSENIIDLRPGSRLYPIMTAAEQGDRAKVDKLIADLDMSKLTAAEKEHVKVFKGRARVMEPLPDNFVTLKRPALR